LRLAYLFGTVLTLLAAARLERRKARLRFPYHLLSSLAVNRQLCPGRQVLQVEMVFQIEVQMAFSLHFEAGLWSQPF